MIPEIKISMNIIIGFTTVLLQTKLHRDQTVYIQTIKESGNAVINKTVDITKTDARKMTVENITFNLSIATATPLPLFGYKILQKKWHNRLFMRRLSRIF